MKRFFKKSVVCIGLTLVILFSTVAFTGCGFDAVVKKAAKNLSVYNIEAQIDTESNRVLGNQKIKYINNTEVVLNEVCFHLYGTAFSEYATVKPYTSVYENKCFPNGINYGDMEVKSVKVKNKPVNYEITGPDNNILKVPLSAELYPSANVSIQMEWVLTLSNNIHRLGYYDTNINLGNWYPVACVYENGGFSVHPYYSTGDPFYTDLANYKITVSYPTGYELASTGNSGKTEVKNNMVTKVLSADAVRDFAMVLGTKFTVKTKKVKDTTVNVFAYTGDEKAAEYLKISVAALKTFNEIFGVYPYRKLDVVFTGFLHGGMEYPSMVMISDLVADELDIKKVIVHEIAHQWWYGIVGNDQVNNAWIDEALAEYSTVLFFEKNKDQGTTGRDMVAEALRGYILYIDVAKFSGLEINTSMVLPTYSYTSDYEYTYMVYIKGILMYDSLREVIGDKVFEKSLKRFYQTYKMKTVKKEHVISVFEKTSGKNLAGFFDSWLNGKVVIGEIK